MKIYTKIGDGGNTQLFGGKMVSKDDARVEAYGAADELNSALGWVISLLKDKTTIGKLEEVQKELFILGADLATPPDTKVNKPVPRLGPSHITRLEKEIDALQENLPPLQTFILPGGSPAGAALHLARSIGRRAERALVSLSKQEKISPDNQIYLNRLSDYLYVLARQVNRSEGQVETPWLPDTPPR